MSINPYYPVGYQPIYPSQQNYQHQPIQQYPQNFNQMQNTQNLQNFQAQQNNPLNMQPQNNYMIWVQGEIGEKSFNRPVSLPPNTTIPLWDSENQFIYLKSWDESGKAETKKLKFEIVSEDDKTISVQDDQPAKYVAQSDFDALKGDCISRKEFNEFKENMYVFLKKNGFTDEEQGKNDKKGGGK